MSLLLEAVDIRVELADRTLFSIDRFQLHAGDRVGLVGANGCGKTTLLQVLSGCRQPDSGQVRRFRPLVLVRQPEDPADGREGEPLPSRSASDADEAEWLRRFHVGGLADRGHAGDMSGGEWTRLRLARAFAREGDLILADEPTNHLDLDGRAVFRRRMEEAESFLVASHDRNLLESLCNRIVELRDGRLRDFPGGFAEYRVQAERERQREWDEYERVAAEKRHLEAALADRRARAKAIRKAPSRMGNSEARLHRREATERQEKLHNAGNAIQSRLSRLPQKERPREDPSLRIDMARTRPPPGRFVAWSDALTLEAPGPGGRILLDRVPLALENRKKTILVGPNGCGKTTLLQALADRHPDLSIPPSVRFGLYRQDLGGPDPGRTVLENALADSVQSPAAVRTLLARLLFRGDDVFKPAGVLSGGERVRLSLARLLVSGANVLLLDEPTNHLDLPGLEALQAVLLEYGGTVVMATHDIALAEAVADRFLVFDGQRLVPVDGPAEHLETLLTSLKRTTQA